MAELRPVGVSASFPDGKGGSPREQEIANHFRRAVPEKREKDEMMPCFKYGKREIVHLKERDSTLGAAIAAIGPIRREVIPDIHAALAHAIVGQQISSKAAATVWSRLKTTLGDITPDALDDAGIETLRRCGMSHRKALYLKDMALRVRSGELDLEALRAMPDDEVRACLIGFRGIGVWTAEMLMIFSLQRPDVVSWGDLAIHRGLCRLYRHRKITRTLFDKYRRRYSPYGSVASLYLWAIAGGAGRQD